MRFKSMILRLLYKKMAKLEIPHVNSKAVGSTLVLTDIKVRRSSESNPLNAWLHLLFDRMLFVLFVSQLSELNIPQKSLKLSVIST